MKKGGDSAEREEVVRGCWESAFKAEVLVGKEAT